MALDEDSSLLTTFQTCFGRFRWQRLPFGTCVSSEIFQKRLTRALGGLQGVICIADDIVIHGKSEDEHDKHLEKFLSRCVDQGIKLNKTKCQWRLREIDFMGHRITANGLQADPEKVKAICQMPAPTDVHGVRRFVGMANYLARYIPNLVADLSPLHQLTKKNANWVWNEEHRAAFDAIKDKVSSAPVLKYYDQDQDLWLENDASEKNTDLDQFYCRMEGQLRLPAEALQHVKPDMHRSKKRCWQWYLDSENFITTPMEGRLTSSLTTNPWYL